MEQLDGGSTIPARLRGGIVALGNFDGFHRGHQAVAGRAVARAHAEGRPAIIATFDPHPVHFFRPDLPPFRLTTLDQRKWLFHAAGADAMLVFSFDAALAALSARQFTQTQLVERLGAAAIVTGADFTFGKGRDGNIAVLQHFGAELGFAVETVAPVSDGDAVVSSSRIRDALQQGNPREAARLLTRAFTLAGIVEHGAQLGRTLNFPTANLRLGDYLRPAYGIYAVRGHLPDGRTVNGVANLGIRPSFDPPVELLEPYFFDFSGDLYGQEIEVELVEYLRPEAKFDSLAALKTQMDADALNARRLLEHWDERPAPHPNPPVP